MMRGPMTEKTGVLFLHSQPTFGADSVVHAHLIRELDRQRFSVHVACAAREGADVPISFGILSQIPNIALRPTHFLPGFRRRSMGEITRSLTSGARAPVDYLALSRYIAKHRIRIIHGTDRPRDAVYSVTLGRVTGARSIVHVHVKWSKEYSEPAKWAVRNADGVIGISRYVSDTVRQMGTPAHRIHTVLNCVDPAKWDPTLDGHRVRRELGIPETAPLLVSVSRLFSWKGQRELVSALPAVLERVPETRLMIVGADEPFVHGGSFTAELKELAQRLGIAERVIFTGARSDIPEVMAASDVFTMPSFEEPFGLVFLEAMAMQRPVVALDNGGTPEVVEDGRSGLLCAPGDVAALSTNIVTLLLDPALRARMGEYGRARVLDYFNSRRMAEDAARTYEAMLGPSPARSSEHTPVTP
jgi:glycosyltransferase involved in cell wall biosynthesis